MKKKNLTRDQLVDEIEKEQQLYDIIAMIGLLVVFFVIGLGIYMIGG